jgi:hypothetical protein
MNVEDVDGVDYTLPMKRRKGEFATIVVEKSRNRTSQVMCLDLALTTLVAEDDAQIPPQS